MVDYLKENGFEILEIAQNGNFFEYIAQELRRVPSCAQKYAGGRVSTMDRLAITGALLMLNRLSGKDRGSNELLCHGLHVLAKKLPG